MKTIKVGSVKIKVNKDGKAIKDVKFAKGEQKYIKGRGWVTAEEAGVRQEDIYCMPFQSRNEIFKGSNGKNKFDPAVFEARSYDHWCYVKKIKGKVVFNWYKYSNTTTGHQYEMNRLLEELGIKVYLKVNMGNSLSHFTTDALKPMYRAMFELEIALKRPNSKPETNKARRASIASLKSDIRKARALGAVFSKNDIDALRQSVLNEETERLERLKAERAARAELLKARRDIVSRGETFELNVA